MLVALMLTMLGVSDAVAQKIYQAELDNLMFKAWTSNEPGATVVENPEAIDDGQAKFGCENNFYKELSGGNVAFGNTNVYYLWYADLTGTKTMTFTGTAGVQLRVLLNRPEPIDPAEATETNKYDAHGGATVEKNVTIGENGTAVLDVSDLEYVHLNCIKLGWGSAKGIIKSIVLTGTVKPVTGLLSMINNGDAEGDDLSSFPVSFDGPNNGGTANDQPEVVSGEGVDGSKCFKVKSHENPTETWHTQFYIKADEVMPNGTKWKLKMSIKADQEALITTSAQAQPRTWRGNFGIEGINVGTEWKDFEWTGEIAIGNEDDFQSIAFDLNNGDETVDNTAGDGTVNINRGVTFYFDNIEFYKDLGGSNPVSNILVSGGYDVICIDFQGMTNLADLVNASIAIAPNGDKTLFYDNNVATVTLNGEKSELITVEARPNGKLYLFLAEDEIGEGDEVKVSFKNPEDAAHKILFTSGRYEGEPVPEFSGLIATYDDQYGEGDVTSSAWGAPTLESVEPENGSFNLPADFKEFKVSFSQEVEASSIVAKLGGEALAVAPASGLVKTVTLTRTSATTLNGPVDLVISKGWGAQGERFGIEEKSPIVVNYSYGPVSLDGDDQPATIYASDFSDTDAGRGAGWYVNAGSALQPANSGSGCRIMHNQGAFAEDLVYIAQRDAANGGVAVYGIDDENKLALEGGKTYHVTLKACRHDRSGVALRVQVLPEDAVNAEDGSLIDANAVLAQDFKAITPEKSSKLAVSFDLAVTPSEAGNFVIRLVPSKEDGSFAGYDDPVCFGDVKVEYIPNVMGMVETKALLAALDDAKSVREANDEERYAGEAFTTLDNLIKDVEANKASYYAPSVYTAKTEALKEAAEAMTDHTALCQEYDALPLKAFEVYTAKKEIKKFTTTSEFTNLVTTMKKYATIGEEPIFDEETGEESTLETLESFTLFYTDADLNAAKNELSNAITNAEKMLTVGESHNWYGGGDRTTGYAALHERLRRGVELLKSLDVPETEPQIVYAESILGDSDDAAEAIMNRAQTEIFNGLSVENNDFFEGGDKTYDLSVFVKNPNIYSPAYSTELPGWTSVRGNCFVFPGWGADHTANTAYPEDCQIHAGWHPSAYPMVEQTITNLPAGVYTINIDGSDNNSTVSAGTYGYVKVSDTPAFDGSDELDPDLYFAGYVACSGDIADITVVDGILTIGFSYGPESQAFINNVKLTLTAPAADHNYAEDIETSIEAPAAAKVRALQVFDLNGRRMIRAQKGLQIVKKQMSDGSVRVEKVVVK